MLPMMNPVRSANAEPPSSRGGRMFQNVMTDLSRRSPVSRELRPVIAGTGCRFRLFDELIQGVEMDLDQGRYGNVCGVGGTVTASPPSWAY